MARDFNQNRIANAKLVSATIDKFGKTFAIQSPWNADGFASVNVLAEQAPTDIKEYLEGNDDITIFACASNIDKLCEYALASFPNIEDLYLFKTSAIVVLDDDLSYLLDLNKIYVPSDLLSAYISAYPTLSSKFDTIVEDYTLTIPFIGETTLTSEYVDSVIAMLSSAEKNAITKLVIPTDFSEESADEIAWYYDFSAIVNLNNNIWYGYTQYDFSVWTIDGSGELTSAIVESAIASIPSSKINGITKIVTNGFSNYNSNALKYAEDTLVNLDSFSLEVTNSTSLTNYSIVSSFSELTRNYLELTLNFINFTNAFVFGAITKFETIKTTGSVRLGLVWNFQTFEETLAKYVYLGEGAYGLVGLHYDGWDVNHLLNCEVLDLPSTITFNAQGYRCLSKIGTSTTNGTTLIIRKDSVLNVGALNILSNAKINKIQVPSNLVASYQADTYWSQFSSKIEAIPS